MGARSAESPPGCLQAHQDFLGDTSAARPDSFAQTRMIEISESCR